MARRDPEAPPSPWDIADAFQFTGQRTASLSLDVDGRPLSAEVTYGPDGPAITVGGVTPDAAATVMQEGEGFYVLRQGRQTLVRLAPREALPPDGKDAGGIVRAPMHGKLLALSVESGAKVVRGQPVAVIEAMKMEHTLTAPAAGIVTDIRAGVGSQIADGAIVMVIETGETDA
jgi:3-methylcrotonyl-CoA carboxylase alpha subunit